jgi:arylsulfatase A-like enzyme
MLTGISPHKLQMFRFREKFPPDVDTFYHYLRDNDYNVATYTVSENWFGENEFVNEEGLTRNTDSVLDSIKELSDDDFFLFAHYWNTHLPYFNKFSREAWYDARDDIIDLIRQDDKQSLRKVKNLYRSSIERASEEFVYAVIEQLQDLDIFEDTYIVVTGDHGESWGDRLDDRSNLTLFGMHGKHLYEEVLQIPLIMTGPDLPSGECIDPATRSIDVMPTLLDLLGIDPPTEIDGSSLLPIINGDKRDGRPIVSSTSFVDNPDDENGVVSKLCYRTENWKLIRNLKEDRYGNEFQEFYDLNEDPNETTNLAEECPNKVEELSAQLDEAQSYLDFSDEENKIIKDRLKELGYL